MEARLVPRFYALRRRLVWAWRWRHSHGFGVQSPWAYRFVCDVVGVRLPYYAYEPLLRRHESLHPLGHRLGRLYFRLANSCQPGVVVDYAPPTAAYADYMRAACPRATVVATAPSHEGAEGVGMARFSPAEGAADQLAQCADMAAQGALFVVEGIGHSRAARRLWRQLKAHPGVSLTFDLYYCGIALFDCSRHKQAYIVNF